MFNRFKKKHLLASTNKLDGFYNGTVVDRVDPKQQSRIRVEIPDLTAGLDKKFLPWYSLSNKISSSPNSKAAIPPQGSQVVVEFPTDDIYNGIVTYVIVSSPPS